MTEDHTDLESISVTPVETQYRRIVTLIPVSESALLFEILKECEPRSVGTQVPVVWDRAEGFQVYDPYGNCWIDFTSGILVANAGHSHPHIKQALQRHIDSKPLHSYLFATEARAKVVAKLVSMTPANLTKVFLLSTGSEAMEAGIKIARLYGISQMPPKKILVSFDGSFHGRTMGSQMLCSAPDHKKWITSPDPDIHQIPFPRCTHCPWGRDKYDNCGGKCFEKGLAQLREKKLDCSHIAAFILEGYQGVRGPVFWPSDYAQALRKWCSKNGALVIVDEIQSGFGRTGKLFAYQHYGIDADLVICGKGMSSSLPLSAVLGRGELMDIPAPGYMTSTHTGNPLCCAATLASLEVLEQENLIDAASRKGEIVRSELHKIQQRHPERISHISGRGLVHSIFFVKPSSGDPDIDLADHVVARAIQKGVLLFLTHNGSVKLSPPLCIEPEPLVEGLEVISDAVDECLAGQVK